MPYKHESSRRIESETLEGVVIYLNKMTEGRRIKLRSIIGPFNQRIREIMREQSVIESAPEQTRDHSKWLDLQDEFEAIYIEKINPEWVKWGVKKVEGLEVEGKPLDVEDWAEWPSVLFNEAVVAVKNEAELNGAGQKKISSSLSTLPERVGGSQSSSIAQSVEKRDSGEIETAKPISQVN